MTTVEDLMTTSVITLTVKDTIGAADLEMKLADIRHLPVVDERDRLVGIVSNRDVLRALGRTERGESVRVADVMTRSPTTIGPLQPAREAAQLMVESKIGALPVVEEDGRLIGIVTETDFLVLAQDLLDGRPPGSSRG